jgi:hypothetical protein
MTTLFARLIVCLSLAFAPLAVTYDEPVDPPTGGGGYDDGYDDGYLDGDQP